MQLYFLTTVAAVSLAFVCILPSTTARALALEKRDLLGGLIPVPPSTSNAPSTPSTAPVTSPDTPPVPPAPKPSPPAPIDPPKQPTTINPPTTTDAPDLPPATSQPSSSPAPSSTPPKRKPPTTNTKGGGGQNTQTDDNNIDDTTASPTPSSSSSGSGRVADPKTDQKVKEQGISPGMIAVVVLVALAVIAAVLFSCYRVQQAKRRRHQSSFDADILKNHVPANNASFAESGGYGLYHGNAAGVIGNKENDPWRKNLDVYHRE
ncbi:hypothetical protein BGZ82_008451 [Podila clonocystis]|nr:hypothetical protein BGZ82_008451 [Podila clonocystis]